MRHEGKSGGGVPGREDASMHLGGLQILIVGGEWGYQTCANIAGMSILVVWQYWWYTNIGGMKTVLV